MASAVKVLDAPHTGITVRSLASAIHLFRDVLNLPVSQPNHAAPPSAAIVGHPRAEIDTVLVELPGGHLVELLEYCSPPPEERKLMKPMSWDVGSWHLCLKVERLDGTIAALEALDAGWAKMASPQTVGRGPYAGKHVVYMRNEQDGMILEFFEHEG